MVSSQDLSYVQSINSLQIIQKFRISWALFMGGQFPGTIFTSFSSILSFFGSMARTRTSYSSIFTESNPSFIPRIQALGSLFLPFLPYNPSPWNIHQEPRASSQVNLALITLASCLSEQMFSFASIQEFSSSCLSNQILCFGTVREFLLLDLL